MGNEMHRFAGLRVRISTCFLALGIVSFCLHGVIPFPGRLASNTYISQLFGDVLTIVILDNLGPIWGLIGAIFALAYLIAFRKQTVPVIQHSLETVLGILIGISFPTY